MSRVVKGRVISGQELKDYAKRNGLCQICGQYQTHKRIRTGVFHTKFEPMTVTNSKGVVTVYKGHCIQPTCYPSVESVKELLGEISPQNKRQTTAHQHHHPHRRAPTVDGIYPTSPTPGVSPGGRGKHVHRPQPDRRKPPPPNLTESPSHHRRKVTDSGDLGGSNLSSGNRHGHPQQHPHHSPRRKPQPPMDDISTDATQPPMRSSDRTTQQQDDISFVPHGTGGAGGAPHHRAGRHHRSNSFDEKNNNSYSHSGNGSSSALGAFDTSASAFPSNAGGGVPADPPTRIYDHLGKSHGDSTGTSEESKQEERPCDPVLEALDAQLADGDFIGFLNRLDDPSIQHYVAVEGMALFRQWVIRDQLERPENLILGFDGWVKTIKTLVDDRFSGDRDITKSGLVTFLSFSTLPGNYRKYMIKRGGIDLFLKVVDEFKDDEQVVNLSCATLSSISSSERDGLSAKYENVVFSVIRKLIQIIAADNGYGKEYAMLALNNLANQRKRASSTSRALGNDIRIRMSENESIVGEITRIVREPDVNLKVAEAGICLLWRRSFPKDEDKEDIFSATEELIETVLYAMQTFKVPEIQQAVCGLIANLALDQQFPTDHAPELMQSICEILADEGVEEATACCGVHAFCNMLSNLQINRRIVSDPNLIPSCFATMKKFPGCEDLMEFGCLTIAQVARDDVQLKEVVVQNGGFGLVHRALEHFVTLRGADPSLVIKDAALCALAAMSGCGAGAQEIVNSGLFEDLQALFAVEADEDFRVVIQAILQNVQIAQSNGGFSSVGRSRNGVLSREPQMFAQLAANSTSQDDAYALLEELVELGQLGLPALSEHGFSSLLNLMCDYRTASLVQENGCAVLAQAYFQLPFIGMSAPVPFSNGSWAVIHKVEAFEAVHRALNLHRREPRVQQAACMAIYNFISSLYEHEQSIREVGNWAKPYFKEAFEAIRNNPGDEFVIKSGVSLFGLLSTVYSSGEAKQYRLQMLQIIFDALNRFTDDLELKQDCLSILMGCEDDMESLAFIANSGGVDMLMSFLEADDIDIVRGSSQILASLVKKMFSASSQVSQMPRAPRELVECMSAHQGDSQIELNTCTILEARFNFGDFSDTATEERMAHVLCDALAAGRTDRNLVEKMCRLLSLLIPLLESEIVESIRFELGPTLNKVMEENSESPLVEAAAMDALWTCCDLMDYFKHSLINEYFLRMLVQIMSLHLGSAELQRSGCSLLWILSGYGHGRQMIGEYGGIAAVVNAMLANNQSTVVQKEGLTVLKNLATASVNKQLIASSGGEDAVQYALWIHYREPQVISLAFSALNNIAVDSERKTVAVMRENVLNIVISAMRRFPREETVQKNSCFYLKSCTYAHANLALMSQKRVELSQVLQQAAALFPNGCRDRASSVLAKIEQFQ